MKSTRTCPWWLAATFDNPFRRFFHNPAVILGDLVTPGQTVIDLGCGMGYFSLAMAKMVAPDGQVIAVDLQSQMLAGARRRAERAGVLSRITLHQSTPDLIDITAQADFILAFWMVHEVQNQPAFLRQACDLLKPEGRFLLVEPRLHVTSTAFVKTVQIAKSVGLDFVQAWRVSFSHAVLLAKGVCGPRV
jgi:ubiquinone/menaquinone biosynthesis C-methylase UbiE